MTPTLPYSSWSNVQMEAHKLGRGDAGERRRSSPEQIGVPYFDDLMSACDLVSDVSIAS
jgi:hypothetical protein